MSNLFPAGRDFMNFGKNFFEDPFDHLLPSTANFNVDIRDEEDAYIVEAELPGMAKDAIQLKYEDNVLSIGATQETSKDEKDDEGNYIRRERSTKSYSRQFLLKNVKEEGIDAAFENGILTVTLPKKVSDETAPKQIEIH